MSEKPLIRQRNRRMRKLLLIALFAVPMVSCADLNPTQQRALTGTVAGAGVGAVAGAIGGNAGLGAAIGAGAGLAGGLLWDQQRRAEDRAFQRGVAAGRQSRSTPSSQ
jgi:outer membrane lipoprotein SlyB